MAIYMTIDEIYLVVDYAGQKSLNTKVTIEKLKEVLPLLFDKDEKKSKREWLEPIRKLLGIEKKYGKQY